MPGLTVVLGAVAALVAACGNPDGSGDAAPSGSEPPMAASTALPPWPAPTEGVPAFVAKAGLALGPMGTPEHYHPNLSIVVEGKDVPVPPNIGVDVTTEEMSALHTHEGDGTIHVEAGTRGEVFTLGQISTQWGVSLGADHVGGAQAKNESEVTVDGKLYVGDPRRLELEPNQRIVLSEA